MKDALTSLGKLFLLSLTGFALATVYGGISPTPAYACSSPTSTQLFCSAAGTAPPGFGRTFQDNLVDPLGGQCTAGLGGCTNDTFVNPGIGDCTDGSTACNAGAGTIIPVSNDPCISCFADPGQVSSLGGGEDDSLQPAQDYLKTQRDNLAAQKAKLDQTTQLADSLSEERRKNLVAINNSKARTKDLETKLDALPLHATDEQEAEFTGPLDEEDKNLKALEAKGRQLDDSIKLAQENLAIQTEIVNSTQGNIDEAERTGKVPGTPGGLLTQFGGGGEATQETYRQYGGKNSSYNKAVAGGEGYTFEPDSRGDNFVDGLFDGAVGSQFIRSTSGHATTGDNLSSGTMAGAELWDKPYLITYVYMKAGLQRKLRDAVRRGDVAGTIEIVKDEKDKSGNSTKEVVTILPGGLEAAKPYLDAQDSLFEGMLEEASRTTSDEDLEREAERREEDRRYYEREAERLEAERKQQQRDNPVRANDVDDNTGPDDIRSIIQDLQGIVTLA